MKIRRNNRSRSKKGGFGGWWRQTDVGGPWNAQNGGNHFALSKGGVLVGGVQPAVPGNWGPDWYQMNRLVPHLNQNALSMGGGSKRSTRTKQKRSTHKRQSRSKRGGFGLGGLPQNIQIGWDNLKIGTQNAYRGFMGLTPLVSASPWVQPGLNADAKMSPTNVQTPYVMNAMRNIGKNF